MEPCGSTNLSISLLHLDDDYVLSNIDKVYPVLIQHFSKSTDDPAIALALKISFGACMNCFALEELDEKLLKHACPVAAKVFIQSLKDWESCGEDNKIKISECSCRCEEITSLLVKAMECVTAKDSTIELMMIRRLLLCSSELLYESYRHCARSKQFSSSYLGYMSLNLTTFFKKVQDLQQNVLRLISKIEISCVESAIDVLNEVLTFLYKSGMLLLNLDVKTMADLWKGYIFTLEKYSEYLKNYHEISVPVECLSSNLTNKIEKFIVEDKIDSQNNDKTVKILCFLLKVIIKITEKFTGCLKNCQNSLLNLLINLNKFSHCNWGIDNMEYTKMEHLRQLVTGLDPLLNCLINDIDFAQEFSLISENLDMNENKRYQFLLLSCLVVKKLTFASQGIRNLWLNSDNNILRWIFQTLAKCNFELCLDLKFPCILIPGKAKRVTDCYGYILMNMSAFLLMSTSREFALAEKVLMKYVLQINPWCSLLAADIWCILARFADSELCYNQLNSLINILHSFGTWSQLPQKYLLESLIKRLFPLLSEKHKDLLIENQSQDCNSCLLSILSARTLPQNMKSGCLMNNLDFVNKFLTNRNFGEKNFEEMESFLFQLDVENMNLNKEVEGKIANLWKFDSGKLVPNPLSKRYMYSLCLATRCIIPFMSSTNIYQVLRQIKSSLSNFSPDLKLYCLDIVYTLAKAEEALNGEAICKLIASLFYEFLTNQNVFIRIRSMDLFSNFAYSTCRTQVITQSINNDSELQNRLKNYLQRKNPDGSQVFKLENYLEQLKCSGYGHCCESFKEIEIFPNEYLEPPHKKIILDKRFDTGQEDSRLEQMIFALKKEAVRIQQHANSLSLAQRKEISLIADMLQETLQ